MTDTLTGPEGFQAEPDRHPPGGNFQEENLTPAQVLARGNTKDIVWSRAVRLDQMVRDPETGELPEDDIVRTEKISRAVEGLIVDAQESAVAASSASDQSSLNCSQQAATHLGEAEGHIAETVTIIDRFYDAPGGGLLPARQIIAEHHERVALATDRERDGDSRHRDTAYPRSVSVLVGVLLFLLDIGIWAKWLGLSAPTTTTMVLKWLVALVVSTILSFAVAWMVERFAGKDRISADLRSAVADYNRVTDRRVRQRQSVGQPPDLKEVGEADRQRAHAQGWLIMVAGAGGTFLALRIALIAIDSQQPRIIGAIVGVVIGLLLCVVIGGLGYKFCRGNTLGDQITEGSDTLEQVQDDLKDATDHVVAERRAAGKALEGALNDAALADAVRAMVVGDASESLLLFGAWNGVPKDLLERPKIDATRELHVSASAREVREGLTDRLTVVDRWLGTEQPGTSPALGSDWLRPAAAALPSGNSERYVVRPVPRPPRGKSGDIVPYRVDLPSRPRSPLMLAAAGAVIITITGLIAALTAPAPEGAPGNDQPMSTVQTQG